jgi:lipopolysaccharide transport protein LptA
MNRSLIFGLIFMVTGVFAPAVSGQDVVKAATATAKESTQTTAKTERKSENKAKGLDLNAGTSGPITTEIYADEAFFDSSKSVGIFRGRVKVTDPRFNVQADKLTVFISKGENQGLEKAVAEGNVAVVRDRPDPNGGPATRAVGRSESAVYVASTGDVELKGMPRVQQGLNTHVGTSPDTVMVINQNGQLTTHGPSRTDIRQEPKEEKGAAKEESKAPQGSPKP